MSNPEAPNPVADRSRTVETANGAVTYWIWDAIGTTASTADGPNRSAAVLIHGVNGSVSSWGRVVELVDRRRPLVAIDLRGRGASPADGPWGVEAHGADVAEVLATLAGDGFDQPVTLVGHSFGAHVAAAAARQAPDLVADLVLVDGGPPRRVPADGGAQAAIDGALGNILPMLADLPFPVSADAVAADFASMVDEGSADDLAASPLAATTRPLTLIRAGNGMAPGLPPIIDDALLADLTSARAGVTTTTLVADATHFSLLGDHAGPVVEAIATLRS